MGWWRFEHKSTIITETALKLSVLNILFSYFVILIGEKKKMTVLLGLEESYTAHVVHDCWTYLKDMHIHIVLSVTTLAYWSLMKMLCTFICSAFEVGVILLLIQKSPFTMQRSPFTMDNISPIKIKNKKLRTASTKKKGVLKCLRIFMFNIFSRIFIWIKKY